MMIYNIILIMERNDTRGYFNRAPTKYSMRTSLSFRSNIIMNTVTYLRDGALFC